MHPCLTKSSVCLSVLFCSAQRARPTAPCENSTLATRWFDPTGHTQLTHRRIASGASLGEESQWSIRREGKARSHEGGESEKGEEACHCARHADHSAVYLESRRVTGSAAPPCGADRRSTESICEALKGTEHKKKKKKKEKKNEILNKTTMPPPRPPGTRPKTGTSKQGEHAPTRSGDRGERWEGLGESV